MVKRYTTILLVSQGYTLTIVQILFPVQVHIKSSDILERNEALVEEVQRALSAQSEAQRRNGVLVSTMTTQQA